MWPRDVSRVCYDQEPESRIHDQIEAWKIQEPARQEPLLSEKVYKYYFSAREIQKFGFQLRYP
jgi:hypothetical protein